MMLLIAMFSLTGVFLFAGQAIAADTPTVNIAARGAECGTEGYISPDEISVSGGDATIAFVNQQPTKLEIRGVPGGSFVVKGNSTVERTFKATGSFTYSAWLETQDCKKAEATVAVKGNAAFGLLPLVLAIVGTAGVFIIIKKFDRKNQKPTDPTKVVAS